MSNIKIPRRQFVLNGYATRLPNRFEKERYRQQLIAIEYEPNWTVDQINLAYFNKYYSWIQSAFSSISSGFGKPTKVFVDPATYETLIKNTK